MNHLPLAPRPLQERLAGLYLCQAAPGATRRPLPPEQTWELPAGPSCKQAAPGATSKLKDVPFVLEEIQTSKEYSDSN